MKKILAIVALLSVLTVKGQQSYFDGKSLVCGSNNETALERMTFGLVLLRNNYDNSNDTYRKSTRLFIDAIEKDTLCCDAYFLAGYSLRLQNQWKEALTFYYVADSLSGNQSSLFKLNMAVAAMNVGLTDLARKKYNEMVRFFPKDPEGFYGVALTSLFIKDFDNGLLAIERAIQNYKIARKPVNDDANFLKAMLLSHAGKYELAKEYFEQIKDTFKDRDQYNAYYSYTLVKLSEQQNDEKLLKKAMKIYNKINNKDEIPDDIADAFNFSALKD
ncbi:tetratricopeptide repeat protein [Flavobacterium sp.]|uniref:tetratricopeptide repeat protein n=1 Tax=Flavobacterium sp. TaxID=239 RepID=UPI002636EBFC|nr:tetratricopeptide repeat protein [Flavobacterium sp.]